MVPSYSGFFSWRQRFGIGSFVAKLQSFEVGNDKMLLQKSVFGGLMICQAFFSIGSAIPALGKALQLWQCHTSIGIIHCHFFGGPIVVV